MNISSTSHKIIWKHWVLEILLWKLDLYEWNEVQILTDSVHSAAYSGTTSIELCHTAAVRGTMKLVFHIFSRSKFSMEHQFHCAAYTGGMAYVYRPSAAVGGGMDGIR